MNRADLYAAIGRDLTDTRDELRREWPKVADDTLLVVAAMLVLAARVTDAAQLLAYEVRVVAEWTGSQ
jgi:hypothetical protein